MKPETYKELAFILFLIICIGLFGNILNLIVFSQKSMRKSSTFRFLIYLSIIDMLVLVICAMDSVLIYGFGFEIRLYSKLTCKLQSFFSYFLTQMSSIVLMCVSIERVLVVCNFSQSASISNIKWSFFKKLRIEKVVTIVTLFLIAINIHYVYYFSLSVFEENPNNQINLLKENKEGNNDSLKDVKFNMKKIVYEKSGLRFYNFINEDLLHNIDLNIIMNSKIEEDNENKNISSREIFSVCYSLFSNSSKYDYFIKHIWIWIDALLYSVIPLFVMVLCSIIIFFDLRQKSKRFFKISAKLNKSLIENRTKRNKQILYMLIATNIFFIVCSLPYCILSYKSNKSNKNTKFSQTLFIVHILSYLNNSFNFVNFILFSQQYREIVLNWYKKIRPKSNIVKHQLSNENQQEVGLNQNISRRNVHMVRRSLHKMQQNSSSIYEKNRMNLIKQHIKKNSIFE